jgi:hypothetical protein
MYFGQPVEPMPALKPGPLAAAQVQKLVGDYQFGADYFVPNALMSIRERDGYLEAAVGDQTFPLVQISPSRFLLRSFWIVADFTIGPNGKASELVIAGRKGSRVPNAGNA